MLTAVASKTSDKMLLLYCTVAIQYLAQDIFLSILWLRVLSFFISCVHLGLLEIITIPKNNIDYIRTNKMKKNGNPVLHINLLYAVGKYCSKNAASYFLLLIVA